jgi:hypothetical protein
MARRRADGSSPSYDSYYVGSCNDILSKKFEKLAGDDGQKTRSFIEFLCVQYSAKTCRVQWI